jgi:prepilin peptidase CpaA
MNGWNHLSQARLIWAVAGSFPAVICDLWRGRIPNTVCALLCSGGLLAAGVDQGVPGLISSLVGVVAGFAVFLIFYLMGGMGGGDVKLMAAYGALLGPGGVLPAALIAAGTGAILAAGGIAAGALRRRRPESIPYAPAIAFGALAVLLSHSAGGR